MDYDSKISKAQIRCKHVKGKFTNDNIELPVTRLNFGN